MAIAGTLASTGSLLGLSHVFPQSSILYGPRSSNSSSAFPGGTRSVQAAPATVTKTVRRVMTSSVVDMVRLLCLDTLHNAGLSCCVLRPTDASAHVTKMFDRMPPVDYLEGNQADATDAGGQQSLAHCPITGRQCHDE